VRIHPAIIGQAAATPAVLTHGRFGFGVGPAEPQCRKISSVWKAAAVR